MGFYQGEIVKAEIRDGKQIFGQIENFGTEGEFYAQVRGIDGNLYALDQVDLQVLTDEEHEVYKIEARAVEILKENREDVLDGTAHTLLKMSDAMEMARMEPKGRLITESSPALPAGTQIAARHFVNDLPVRIITIGKDKASVFDIASPKPQVVTVDRSEIETRWMTAKEWETAVGLSMLTRQPSDEESMETEENEIESGRQMCRNQAEDLRKAAQLISFAIDTAESSRMVKRLMEMAEDREKAALI